MFGFGLKKRLTRLVSDTSVKFGITPRFNQLIVDNFHRLYYDKDDSHRVHTYLGFPIKQCPFDMHLYQELIYRIRPPFILQTGVENGGSIIYFASLLDQIGADPSALVIGVDIILTEKAKELDHPRIRLIEGSSTAPEVIAKVRALLPPVGGFVVLDSDHSEKHVYDEMKLYSEFVSVGSYMVVEDTNINGHPVLKGFGPGPLEAVDRFLKEEDRFQDDAAFWKRNYFSFHQNGWLKRVKA
jgi:cephalosporin hydroxylase